MSEQRTFCADTRGLAAALDRGLATGRLIEEAERLIRTILHHRKLAVRELPVLPLLAAVARMKEME